MLREIFADNAEMLDFVTDNHVLRFVELIRKVGREERFVEFLTVLCDCNAKAVRTNQWRVCQLFVEKAPELLLNLRLDGAHVVITADPAFFPAFRDAPKLELSEWLRLTTPSNAAYFSSTMNLLSQLVRGRNLKNRPAVQALLPYDLVEAAITSPLLNAGSLKVVTQFVQIAIDCYIDHEPHEVMARVRNVRIWDNVEKAAESRKLSTRLTTTLDVDWHRFDGLKEYAHTIIARLKHQSATEVVENNLMLALVRAIFCLVRLGFYHAAEVEVLVPKLLTIVDGTGDKMGLYSRNEEAARANERYKVRVDSDCNTFVIMETKVWACKVLSLVVTMRVDIRLSLLLWRYKQRFEAGAYKPNANTRSASLMHSVGSLGSSLVGSTVDAASTALGATVSAASTMVGATVDAASTVVGAASMATGEEALYARLEEGTNSGARATRKASFALATASAAPTPAVAPKPRAPKPLNRQSTKALLTAQSKAPPSTTIAGLFDILSLQGVGDGSSNLLSMLFDLTFYEHKQLVEVALELVVRHFQQKRTLFKQGRAAQLLVKPQLVQLYSTFEALMKRLDKLAARRKLFANEKYDATRLMGLLTLYCYHDEPEPLDPRVGSFKGSFKFKRTGSSREATLITDHTDGLFLLLVGRAIVTLGSTAMTMTHLDTDGGHGPAALRVGDRIQLLGSVYTITDSSGMEFSVGQALTLDRPLALELPAGVHHGEPPMPLSLKDGGSGEVWVMLEKHASGMNLDCQLLLLSMGAHKAAIELLKLPFDADTIVASDLETRAVLRASYRLIKAMTVDCPKMQRESARYDPPASASSHPCYPRWLLTHGSPDRDRAPQWS